MSGTPRWGLEYADPYTPKITLDGEEFYSDDEFSPWYEVAPILVELLNDKGARISRGWNGTDAPYWTG